MRSNADYNVGDLFTELQEYQINESWTK